MSEPICSECVNAALDSSGVYCKMFGESIFDERTARDCGAFEAEPSDGSANGHAMLVILPSWQAEGERTLSVRVDVDYFGKEENGEKILKNLESELALRFGGKVKVKRV